MKYPQGHFTIVAVSGGSGSSRLHLGQIISLPQSLNGS